jgi:hypothetical protein
MHEVAVDEQELLAIRLACNHVVLPDLVEQGAGYRLTHSSSPLAIRTAHSTVDGISTCIVGNTDLICKRFRDRPRSGRRSSR